MVGTPKANILFNWMDSTFPSRQRVEELMRPEIESGELTYHDFELAKDYLPGNQRYWRYTSYATSLATASYGVYFRRPRWGWSRTFLLTGIAGIAGEMVGFAMRLSSHSRFMGSLENRDGFVRAIGNMMQKRHQEAASRKSMSTEGSQPVSHELNQGTPAGSQDESVVTVQAERNTPSKPQDSWSQIRADHAKNNKRNSSWDELRLSKGSGKLQAPVKAKEQSSDVWTVEDQSSERLSEQADFDAMLEAERRSASGER